MAVTNQFPNLVPGEPFDLAYLTRITEYVQHFNSIISQYDTKFHSLDGQLTPLRKQKIFTKRVHLSGSSKTVIPKGNTNPWPWSTDFGGIKYKAAPVVVATPFCDTSGGGTNASNSCWLKSVTQSSCAGTFSFNEGPFQNEKVIIMVMAFGILP